MAHHRATGARSLLDVAIRFGFNVIRGGILDVARYGVWSYHHGDHREYRGSPAFFWEMYEVMGAFVDRLIVQVGGGALAASVASARSSSGVHPRFHAVQTDACAPLARA